MLIAMPHLASCDLVGNKNGTPLAFLAVAETKEG